MREGDQQADSGGCSGGPCNDGLFDGAGLYQTFGSPSPLGPPVRYPQNFPLCTDEPPNGGAVYVPLHIRVYSGWIVNPVVIRAMQRKYPGSDGCADKDFLGDIKAPFIIDFDRYNALGNWGSLDLSGQGYFFETGYRSQILNEKNLNEESARTRAVAQYWENEANIRRSGTAPADVVEVDEEIVVNGLKWRHKVIRRYQTPTLDDVTNGTALGMEETYEHAIDDSHVLRRQGAYGPMAISDQQWLSARRDLLRKMVEAVRIERVTDEQIAQLRVERERQNKIYMNCTRDRECDARRLRLGF
jgi:hypothetical protein